MTIHSRLTGLELLALESRTISSSPPNEYNNKLLINYIIKLIPILTLIVECVKSILS